MGRTNSFIPHRKKNIMYLSAKFRLSQDPHCPLHSGTVVALSCGGRSSGVEFTTCRHVVKSSEMRGTFLQLTSVTTWQMFTIKIRERLNGFSLYFILGSFIEL